jgi:hypothetical protein
MIVAKSHAQWRNCVRIGVNNDLKNPRWGRTAPCGSEFATDGVVKPAACCGQAMDDRQTVRQPHMAKRLRELLSLRSAEQTGLGTTGTHQPGIQRPLRTHWRSCETSCGRSISSVLSCDEELPETSSRREQRIVACSAPKTNGQWRRQ